jgi:hypothetical protein
LSVTFNKLPVFDCHVVVQMLADGHTYINIDAQHIKASSPRPNIA